jgi:hypothetical protein
MVTAAQWDSINSVLIYAWVFVFFLGSFAGNLLIAHSLIPSFYTTGHISSRVHRIRPAFYGLAVIFGVATVWTLIQLVDTTEVLRTIYPKTWI